jgi:nodulation protein E
LNRVVITGMGAITACGTGADCLWNAARDGVSGVRSIEFPENPRQRVKHAASIPAADIASVWERANPRVQDRVAAIALTAAREAVAQAGLAEAHFGPKCGVVIGSGFGGAETLEKNMMLFVREPQARGDPMSVPKIMTNAPASWVSMEFGARGATLSPSAACSSATQSIGLAAQMIRHGMLDRCLAGGSEALLTSSVFRAWELLHVMTAGSCRPFSEGRDGMVLGEGAGVLVLESLEAARRRGATIIAEVAGYATTSDAGDLLRPEPRGATECMMAAVRDADIEVDDIAYVNAHGTGTVANELSETEALRQVFGRRVEQGLVSSTKPIHGHALGAAGAIEFIVAVKALCEQVAPPTINFKQIDPKLGIDPIANGARPFAGRACLSNSFAFGGINASLVARLVDA